MSDELFGFTATDVERTGRALTAFESGRLDRNIPQPAQTLPGPRWTLFGKLDGTLTGVSGSTPGTAVASVWLIDPATEHYADSGLNVVVRNGTAEAIIAGAWVGLIRDPKSGEYWAVSPSIASVTPPLTASTSGSGTLATGVGESVGDLLVAFLMGTSYLGAGENEIWPAGAASIGWIPLAVGRFGSPSNYYWLGCRRRESGDSSWDWHTHLAGLGSCDAVGVYVSGSAAPLVGDAWTSNSSTGMPAPSISIPVDNTLLLYFSANATRVTPTAPSGFTPVLALGGVSVSKFTASKGYTGTETGSLAGASANAAILVALSPLSYSPQQLHRDYVIFGGKTT